MFSKQEYALKLRDFRWKDKRVKILTRDNYTCRLCGDFAEPSEQEWDDEIDWYKERPEGAVLIKEHELHVHHLKYTSPDPWDENDENLIVLCDFCHKKAHIVKDQCGEGVMIAWCMKAFTGSPALIFGTKGIFFMKMVALSYNYRYEVLTPTEQRNSYYDIRIDGLNEYYEDGKSIWFDHMTSKGWFTREMFGEMLEFALKYYPGFDATAAIQQSEENFYLRSE